MNFSVYRQKVKSITRHKISVSAISVFVLILQFCLLTFLSTPETDSFDFSSINPLSIIKGFIFPLSFGFGFPIWLSVNIHCYNNQY